MARKERGLVTRKLVGRRERLGSFSRYKRENGERTSALRLSSLRLLQVKSLSDSLHIALLGE